MRYGDRGRDGGRDAGWDGLGCEVGSTPHPFLAAEGLMGLRGPRAEGLSGDKRSTVHIPTRGGVGR